jgi:hypothetical protein
MASPDIPLATVKTPWLFGAFLAACVCGTAVAGTPITASPESQKLAIWYGEWTYSGEIYTTALGPGAKVTGRMTGRPVQNGWVGEFVYVEKGPAGETRYLELDFWDPALQDHAYVFLGDDGSVERGVFSMKGEVTTYEGSFVADGKPYRLRGVETVSPDRLSFAKTTEISDDGRSWHPYAKYKYSKVTSSSQTAP